MVTKYTNHFIIRVNLICAMIARANSFDFSPFWLQLLVSQIECNVQVQQTYLAFPFFPEFVRTILYRVLLYSASKIARQNACLNRSNPDNTEELTRKFICYIDCDIFEYKITHNNRRFPISTF